MSKLNQVKPSKTKEKEHKMITSEYFNPADQLRWAVEAAIVNAKGKIFRILDTELAQAEKTRSDKRKERMERRRQKALDEIDVAWSVFSFAEVAI